MSTDTKEIATKWKSGKVRLSYVNVFTPRAVDDDPDGDKKYSVSVLVPKDDKEQVAALKAAIEAAKQLGKSKWGGKFPPKLKMPLRDGDEEKPDDEAYAGHWFFTASSKNKPGIIDLMKNEITDPEVLYSGCYGRVVVNFYPFSKKSNGVAAGLNNIQKVKDGDQLGGARVSAEEDFDDDFELEDDDASDFI